MWLSITVTDVRLFSCHGAFLLSPKATFWFSPLALFSVQAQKGISVVPARELFAIPSLAWMSAKKSFAAFTSQ